MRDSRLASLPGRASGAGRFLDSLSEGLLRLWYTPESDVPRSLPVAALRAASRLYAAGLRRDQAKSRRERVKLPVPVISVGNLTVGGTGKTPLTIWLCNCLTAQGLAPAVLSRGYGRSGRKPARVPSCGDPRELSARFGDEPALMARELPSVAVWVGRKRAGAGREALSSGATDVLLLDDGFQHLALERDLDLVLLDARNPFGNGLILPAGPLREPVSHLQRADALILTRAGKDSAESELRRLLGTLFPGKPVFSCRHEALCVKSAAGGPGLPVRMLRGRRAVAFAGIARPGRFFKSLEDTGALLRAAIAFPDHHPYTRADLGRILAAASARSAGLIVTTAKDAVRLPEEFREKVHVLHVGLDFGADDEPFRAFVARRAVMASA